jgi:hypothetical protein
MTELNVHAALAAMNRIDARESHILDADRRQFLSGVQADLARGRSAEEIQAKLDRMVAADPLGRHEPRGEVALDSFVSNIRAAVVRGMSLHAAQDGILDAASAAAQIVELHVDPAVVGGSDNAGLR